VRTGIFPGHWGPSRVKGCVLSESFQAVQANLVTSPLVRDSRMAEPVAALRHPDPCFQPDRDTLLLRLQLDRFHPTNWRSAWLLDGP
jgi:hypothetical protein